MRDLGRAGDVIRHSGDGLRPSGEFARSDFFVSIVLADAHLRSGDIGHACHVTLRAPTGGEQTRSARCVSYLREFMGHLPVTDSRALADFREQATEWRLWRIATSRKSLSDARIGNCENSLYGFKAPREGPVRATDEGRRSRAHAGSASESG
jgi:hypothetical protein